jgi:hypothetical protein
VMREEMTPIPIPVHAVFTRLATLSVLGGGGHLSLRCMTDARHGSSLGP